MIKKTKRVTLSQIAEQVGVSIGVVSIVLNGRKDSVIGVSEEVAQKIKDVASELNYRPNAAARMMVTQQTKLIGVIIPNKPGREGQSPMSYETILGIEDGLQSLGYVLVLVRMHDLMVEKDVQSRVFSEDTLDGVIVIDAMSDGEVEWINSHFNNTVWCDSNEWSDKGCVRRDEEAVGKLIAEYMIDKGFKKFTIVGSEPPQSFHYSLIQRRQGIEQVAKIAGVKTEFINIYDESEGQLYEETLLERIKKDSAVIAITHPVAEALVLTTTKYGLLPGKDFSFISCDDPHALSWRWENLTRMSFDRYAMGKTSADMIINQIKNKKRVVSVLQKGELIEGSTVIC